MLKSEAAFLLLEATHVATFPWSSVVFFSQRDNANHARCAIHPIPEQQYESRTRHFHTTIEQASNAVARVSHVQRLPTVAPTYAAERCSNFFWPLRSGGIDIVSACVCRSLFVQPNGFICADCVCLVTYAWLLHPKT